MRHSRLALTLAALASWIQPASAIVGPSRDADAEIAARTVMVLQRRGPSAGFCTGVVVGPRAVLTAAHCVPPGAEIRVHYRDAAGAPVLLPVTGVTRHPGYRADAIARRERSIDLAVATLEAPLPPMFRAATLGSGTATTVGARFTVAGFGLAQEGEPRTSGRLREADLAARAPLSDVLLWAEDPEHAGAGACTGDSGGPVFGASGDVEALTLWSAGEGRRQCGSLTQALWLAPYRDWIAGAAGR